VNSLVTREAPRGLGGLPPRLRTCLKTEFWAVIETLGGLGLLRRDAPVSWAAQAPPEPIDGDFGSAGASPSQERPRATPSTLMSCDHDAFGGFVQAVERCAAENDEQTV
jgi:hypothetical protein